MAALPRDERLLQLAPGSTNPSRGGFAFDYEVCESGPVRLTVHDVAGRRVSVLTQERRTAGTYRAAWDGRSDSGRAVSPGVYFVRLETSTGTDVQSVTRVR